MRPLASRAGYQGTLFTITRFLFLPALKFYSPHVSLLIKNLPSVSSLLALESQPKPLSSQLPFVLMLKMPQLVLRSTAAGQGRVWGRQKGTTYNVPTFPGSLSLIHFAQLFSLYPPPFPLCALVMKYTVLSHQVHHHGAVWQITCLISALVSSSGNKVETVL